MDEMALILEKFENVNERLDAMARSNADHAEAQRLLLVQQMRYGDRQVSALVTAAQDRHDTLRRDFDALRGEFNGLRVRFEASEVASERRVADEANKKIEWNRQTVIALIGWVVALAAVVVNLAK